MKSTLTGLMILFGTIAFAQSKVKDSTQSCVAYWNNGETKSYSITHIKEKTDNGKSLSKATLNYDVEIKVTDSTSDGYTLEWNYKEFSSKKNDAMADMALAFFKGQKIIYKTSNTGEFKELVNWKEVRDFYIAMIEKSIPKNVDDSTKMMLQKTRDMFATREMVEGTLIKEIQLLHAPNGYEYSTKGTTTKTSIPSPFGTDPIPSLVTVRITELRPKQDYFCLRMGQQIDKEGALKMIRDFFKKMNIVSHEEIEEGMKVFKTFEVTDKSDYYISISTGWVSSLMQSRIVNTGTIRQLESYSIEETK